MLLWSPLIEIIAGACVLLLAGIVLLSGLSARGPAVAALHKQELPESSPDQATARPETTPPVPERVHIEEPPPPSAGPSSPPPKPGPFSSNGWSPTTFTFRVGERPAAEQGVPPSLPPPESPIDRPASTAAKPGPPVARPLPVVDETAPPPTEIRTEEQVCEAAPAAEPLAPRVEPLPASAAPSEDALKAWLEEALPKTPGARTAAVIWRNVQAKTPAALRATPAAGAAQLVAALEVLGKLAPEVFLLASTREALGALAEGQRLQLIWPEENAAFDPLRHQSSTSAEGAIRRTVRPGLQADDGVRLKASVARA